ncbi:KH domain-containing protein [Latilactobacillus sakei]
MNRNNQALKTWQLNQADQPEKAPMRQSREATIEALKQYITDITAQIGTPVTMTVTKEHKQVIFHLKTTKEGLLIGKHGKTINALQYLAQTYYDHHTKGKQLMMLGCWRLSAKKSDNC